MIFFCMYINDWVLKQFICLSQDNSLQALWSNGKGQRRLISIGSRNRISIFDSGPGMDGSDGNLVKWDGKYGSIFAPINERKSGRG
ncbi:hypothetical protein ACS0TY_033477 [Phlomoides rotata]